MTAIEKVSRNEAVEIFDQVARRQEPRIARALLDALERVRDRVNATQLAQLIEVGDIRAIEELLDISGVEEDLQPIRTAISQAVTAGARAGAEVQDPVMGANGQMIDIVFDGQNPRVAQFAQQISSTRIREINNDVREVVRGVITEGAAGGENPLTTARRVRDSVGLTQRQERSVQNYRNMLENASREALDRELRDRRSDGPVSRAAAENEPLPQARIDRLVERYRNNMERFRARTIARTESLRAVNGANYELIQSYIDEGRIDERQVLRFWVPTVDDRTRDAHLTLPLIPSNANGVRMREPFRSELGPIMYPGDPNAVPANTINCRCTVFNRIISRELI